MLFNSIEFVILVITTSILYYVPGLVKLQPHILILASFIFYAYGQPYLLLLLISSAAINTVASFKVVSSDVRRTKIWWAGSGVVANLLILSFFKYNRLLGGLFYNDLGSAGSIGHLLVTVPLPVGISFYTFQGISLVVDVLRKREHMASLDGNSFTSHLKNTFLFISFFSQLVAGPIVKAHTFYPQIRPKYLRDVNWDKAIRAILLGYFLKMVVADNLAEQTAWLKFPFFQYYSTVDLSVFLIGYSAQIFADFAGYSLIAIGTARLFGYEIPDNFNFPYIAQSFSEFWKRWHISLSTWLKEYLYAPLGGSRVSRSMTYANLLIVMGLGGLWHGAAWSYAVWGLWHGIALCVERPFLKTKFFQSNGIVLKGGRMLLVFLFVSFSWLLFKLPDFRQVILFLQSLIDNIDFPTKKDLVAAIVIYSMPVFLYHVGYLVNFSDTRFYRFSKNLLYGCLLFAIMANSGPAAAFIYFQF